MKKIPLLINKITPLLLICFGLMVLNVKLNTQIPARDSGVFVYIAQQFLNGKKLYVDLWDHKPPGIYLINAFGLTLSNQNLWGVWFIETLFLSVSILICHKLLSKNFGQLPAFFGTLTFIVLFSKFMGGGNFTEEYVSFFELIGLYLVIHTINNRKKHNLLQFFIGVVAAIITSLKINSIGFIVGYFLYRMLNTSRVKVKYLVEGIIYFSMGYIFLIGLIILLIYSQNGFGAFIDQVFTYNFKYIALSFETSKITVIKNTLNQFWPLLIIIFISLIISLRQFKLLKKQPLVITSFIAFIIEIIMNSISGRTYIHYQMTAIPFFSILFAWSLNTISQVNIPRHNKIKSYSTIILVILYVLLFAYSGEALSIIKKNLDHNYRLIDRKLNIKLYRFNNFDEKKDVLDLIAEYTSKDDYVLIWGSEVSLNYISKRRSPTKYFYQYPLFNLKYINKKMVNDFVNEIKTNKPKLIIDAATSAVEEGMLPGYAVEPIEENQRKKWLFEKSFEIQPEIYKPFFNFVDENYEFLQNTFINKWPVYIRKG